MGLLVAGCATAETAGTTTALPPATATTSTNATSTTSTTTTSTTTTSTTTTSTTTTTTSTTTSTTSTTVSPVEEVLVLGTSVEGRPIEAHRRGTPGGTPVLVVGVIHGNEPAGEQIARLLLDGPVPEGLELWVVPTMNPDGQARGIRQNANRVDLNRNFPERWDVLGEPGDWQYGGPFPASEPETQAMLRLAGLVEPQLVLWYHQDLFRISPASGRDGEVRARYAALTGLPLVPVTGGTYTGTASIWSRSITAPGGVGFTVELGPTLSAEEARRHAEAVLTVAREL